MKWTQWIGVSIRRFAVILGCHNFDRHMFLCLSREVKERNVTVAQCAKTAETCRDVFVVYRSLCRNVIKSLKHWDLLSSLLESKTRCIHVLTPTVCSRWLPLPELVGGDFSLLKGGFSFLWLVIGSCQIAWVSPHYYRVLSHC